MEINQAQSTFLLVLVIAFLAVVYILIFGPSGHIRKGREAEAKRLENKIRVGGGLELINDFMELARAYIKLGRNSDAESAMRKALAMAENEYGKKNERLAPVIKTYAWVLARSNRTVEAENMQKRIKDLS